MRQYFLIQSYDIFHPDRNNIILSGGENITIYADILFLINFSMDFLSLYLTVKVIHRRYKRLPMLLSSAMSALIGTLSVIFVHVKSPVGSIISLVLGYLTSMLMLVISVGKYSKITELLRESVILWGVGALLGGIMTLIISTGPHIVNTDISCGFSEIFIICAAVSCLLVRMFSSTKSKKSAEVSFVYKGQKYTFDGLCDSGSHACEPISSLPAIIVSQKVLGELGNELERDEFRVKLRLIPIKTAAGKKLLRGFVPDKVLIDGKEVAAVIASDSCGGDYGGYSAIIPAKLF